jgi:hypothetical protein
MISNRLYQKISSKLILRRSSSFGGGPPVVLQDPVKPEKEKSSRWIVLLLACLLLFGNFYAFDTPAAINIPLREHLGVDYQTWQYYLNLFYSVYSFPNMFLPLIGGHLFDRFPKRYVLMGLSLVVCLGQGMFSFGVWIKDIRVMILGRFIFGLGGESLAVTQTSITTMWFQGKELAFALGMSISNSCRYLYFEIRFSCKFNHVTSNKQLWRSFYGDFLFHSVLLCFLCMCSDFRDYHDN